MLPMPTPFRPLLTLLSLALFASACSPPVEAPEELEVLKADPLKRKLRARHWLPAPEEPKEPEEVTRLALPVASLRRQPRR